MAKRDDVQVIEDVPFDAGAVRYLTRRTPFNTPTNDSIDVVSKRCVEVSKSYAPGLEAYLRSEESNF